jgi:outer membrane protein
MNEGRGAQSSGHSSLQGLPMPDPSDRRDPYRFRRRLVGLILLLAALIALAFLRPAHAQDARLISFQEAVRIALERNSELRQVQTGEQIDEVAVHEARMQFLPDLRLSSNGARNYGRSFDQAEGRVVDQTTRSFSVGMNSGVTVFDGFGNTASLALAKENHNASRLDVQRSRETVVFTVASTYLALIQNQEQLRVQRENLAAEQQLLEQIQSYVNAGARTIADLYQQQANVASARFAVVEGERSTELTKVDLMQTLMLDPHGIYEFEPPAPETLSSSEPGDVQNLLKRAYEQRTDLDAEEARVRAAEQSIRIARSNRWPTVSLNAGYSSGYTSASDFSFSDQLDQRRGGSIGLGFTLPLYDRAATASATRRAELQTESARISLETRQNDVGLQVRRASLDYRAALEQFSAAEAQQRAAELALKTSQERYQAGASTLVEVSQARASQVQAASSLVSARYNTLFQRVLMDYYVGDLDPDRVSGATR